jgi:hypothetical protein
MYIPEGIVQVKENLLPPFIQPQKLVLDPLF